MMVTRETMKDWVIAALKYHGGKAWPKDVAQYIWENYEAKLRLSGSMLWTWQYDARWAAQTLRNEGILKPVNRRTDLPWELLNQ